MRHEYLISHSDGDLGMGVAPVDWFDCADYYYKAGSYEKAKSVLLEHFKKYQNGEIEYKSYKTMPMTLFSKIYLRNDDARKAIKWSKQALASEYSNPADREQYIWCLLSLNREDEAEKEYKIYINEDLDGRDDFEHVQPLKKGLFG